MLAVDFQGHEKTLLNFLVLRKVRLLLELGVQLAAQFLAEDILKI